MNTLRLLALVASCIVTACCSAAPAPAPTSTPAPEKLPTPAYVTVAEGGQCGGIAPRSCQAGLFCDQPEHCGMGDQSGTCMVTPQVCTRDYRPVCGCNGTTYGNACSAHAAGVSVRSQGECPKPE